MSTKNENLQTSQNLLAEIAQLQAERISLSLAEYRQIQTELEWLRTEVNRANNLLNKSRVPSDYPPDSEHCTICGGLVGGAFRWMDEKNHLRAHEPCSLRVTTMEKG